MKKVLKTSMWVSFAIVLTACNTIHGMGKDVEKAGEVVHDAAKK